MPFHNLPGDAITDILVHCDVYTVLCVSRVNQHFRAIALEKHLWISLLRHLEFRGLINFPPEETFERLATEDLINEVKGIVLGPKTWATLGRAPVPKRQVLLPLYEKISVGHPDMRLLAGGRYFTFHNQASLIFFDAATTGRTVWSYTHPAPFRFWSHDMSRGGDDVFVAVAGPDLNHNAVHILRVDLARGLSETLAQIPLPDHLRYLSPPVILGDFLAISFEIQSEATILVLLANWRSEEHILINCQASHPSRVGEHHI
ncbi:hypothetical protein DFH09DRAFT_53157 [Mycena vulgaris]|nr:hypothetical protein DFH09DRAFT_53157 [Mycena vulgaris]